MQHDTLIKENWDRANNGFNSNNIYEILRTKIINVSNSLFETRLPSQL